MTHQRICPLALAAVCCLPLLAGCAAESQKAAERSPDVEHRVDEAGINFTLDQLHDAASKADGDRYFDLFAPEAVFLGTDATERWTKAQFAAYARPYFSQGKGWTYLPHDRHIAVSADGTTAWFDEQLRNEKYGQCRGSGVLVRTSDQSAPDGGWKIAQYNLTVPIPNDLMPKVAEMIREQK